MGRKNQQQALLAGPPSELESSQKIAKVATINGNNIYTVIMPDLPKDVSVETLSDSNTTSLVELPPRFRNSMWIRRGGFVLVDCAAFDGRENKLAGEIMTVIHDEKSWRKMPYWPAVFAKEQATQPTRGAEEQDGADNVDGDDEDDILLAGGNQNRWRRYDSSDEE